VRSRKRTIGARRRIEGKTTTPSLSIKSEFARTVAGQLRPAVKTGELRAGSGRAIWAKIQNMSPQRTEVFVSYSHADERWLKRLMTNLSPLIREIGISVWHDGRIEPGMEWQVEIENALKRAAVAVLLVTPNFLASRFIAKNELPPLLASVADGGVRILWIAVAASLYEITAISKYEAVNDPSRPLDVLGRSPGKLGAELVHIAKEIYKAYSSATDAGLSGVWQDVHLGEPYDRQSEIRVQQVGKELTGTGSTSAEQGLPDSPFAFRARLTREGTLRGTWWTIGQHYRAGAVTGRFDGVISAGGNEVRLRRTAKTIYGTTVSDWIWRRKPTASESQAGGT